MRLIGVAVLFRRSQLNGKLSASHASIHPPINTGIHHRCMHPTVRRFLAASFSDMPRGSVTEEPYLASTPVDFT